MLEAGIVVIACILMLLCAIRIASLRDYQAHRRGQKHYAREVFQTPLGEFVKYTGGEYWTGSVEFEGEEVVITVSDLYGEPHPGFLFRLPNIICNLPELVRAVRERVSPSLEGYPLTGIGEEVDLAEKSEACIFFEGHEVQQNEDGFCLYFSTEHGPDGIALFKGNALVAIGFEGF